MEAILKLALEGGPTVLALLGIILLILMMRSMVKKPKCNDTRCLESPAMTTMHLNSIHNREALDALATAQVAQNREMIKQTVCLKIIARNGKGELFDFEE